MRKAFAAGLLLTCGYALTAQTKPDPLVFLFVGVDRKQDIAVLRPMIAPDLGVQLASGPRTLEPGSVLRCEASSQAHKAIVEGQSAEVSELTLKCGEHTFVVKNLQFAPQKK